MYITFLDPETDCNYIGEYLGSYEETVESLWYLYTSDYESDTRYCIDFSTFFTYGQDEIVDYDIARCFSSEAGCYLTVYVGSNHVLDHLNYLENDFGYSDPHFIEPNVKCKFVINVPVSFDSELKQTYGYFQGYGQILEIYNLNFPEDYFFMSNDEQYENEEDLDVKERYFRLCDSLIKFEHPLLNVYPYDYLENNNILNKEDSLEFFQFVLVEGFLDDKISEHSEDLFTYFLLPIQLYIPMSNLDLEVDFVYSSIKPEFKKWFLLLHQYCSANYIKASQLMRGSTPRKRLFNIEVSDDLSSQFEIDLVSEELVGKVEGVEYILDYSTCGYKLDSHRFFGFFSHSLLLTNDIYERLFFILILRMSVNNNEVMYVDIKKIQERIKHHAKSKNKPYCLISILHLPKNSRCGLKIESNNEYVVYTSMQEVFNHQHLSVTLDSSLIKTKLPSEIKNKLNQNNIHELDSIMSFNDYIINK